MIDRSLCRLFRLILLAVGLTAGTATAQDDAVGEQAKSSQIGDSEVVPGAEFEVKKTPNLQYREPTEEERGVAATCDVYLPQPKSGKEAAGDRSWPVIVVVHGGGWVTGNKWTMDRHARQLAAKGFAAVSINYRLAPSAKFPEQVDDVRSALVWVSENAKTYSFDPQRVGLYGYSAGGHLVSLVATTVDEPWQRVRRTTSWKQDDERWSKIPRIQAVCIGGPPTDFRYLPPDNTALSFFLGGTRRELPDVYAAASPICFTSAKDPPFQIIHGEADGIVPVKNAKDFHKALVDANVDASLETLPGKGHLLSFISPKLTHWMLAFFEEQLAER